MDEEETSFYHGRITREDAVARLQREGQDGSFLLRMSTTEDGEASDRRSRSERDRTAIARSDEIADRTDRSERSETQVTLSWPISSHGPSFKASTR